MSDITTMLDIIIDTLEQKDQATKLIDEITLKQKELIDQGDYDGAKMNALYSMKQTKIEKINALDEGFVETYSRVKIYLDNQPDTYRDYVVKMQDIIKNIGEMGVSIQVNEMRNSRLLRIKEGLKERQVGDSENPASGQLAKQRIDAYSKLKKK